MSKYKVKFYKAYVVLLLIFGLILMDYLSYQINSTNSLFVQVINKIYLSHFVDNAKDFYRNYTQPLETDEYMMLMWFWPEYSVGVERVFDNDPFYRMYSDKFRVSDLYINREIDSFEDLKVFQQLFGNDRHIYSINDNYMDVLTDPTDELVLKALYCDDLGYDEFDYELLGKMRDNVGGYGDTHYLLSLIFLEKFNCFDKDKILIDKNNVVNTLSIVQNRDDVFSDLFVERIMMLFWSGNEERVKLAWMFKIIHNMQNDNGWKDVGEDVSNPHTTGLAVLALKCFIEQNCAL